MLYGDPRQFHTILVSILINKYSETIHLYRTSTYIVGIIYTTQSKYYNARLLPVYDARCERDQRMVPQLAEHT